jgi:hypothetical protein
MTANEIVVKGAGYLEANFIHGPSPDEENCKKFMYHESDNDCSGYTA